MLGARAKRKDYGSGNRRGERLINVSQKSAFHIFLSYILPLAKSGTGIGTGKCRTGIHGAAISEVFHRPRVVRQSHAEGFSSCQLNFIGGLSSILRPLR
ncbi:MAG TPA: hypothetical protein VKG02_24550, partial [Blastocatellia bacterium]|nr:hypothetical protein [Blastocatellia bacterium]